MLPSPSTPPSLVYNICRYQKFCETEKRSSTRWFGTVTKNTFDGKLWYPPPLWRLTFFNTKNFLKYSRFLCEMNQQCDKKQPRPKNVTSASSLIPNICRYQTFRETNKGSLRSFLVLWDIKFSIKHWDIPFLRIKTFDTRNFVKHRWVPSRSFLVLWDYKLFLEIRDVPVLGIKIFDIQTFSETMKGSSTKWFGTVRQNNSQEKMLYLPFLFSLTFFDIKNFLNPEWLPYHVFRPNATKEF